MKWRIAARDVVLKALGVLLLVAAVLKAHEVLTVPMVRENPWSWRPWRIFQAERELVLHPSWLDPECGETWDDWPARMALPYRLWRERRGSVRGPRSRIDSTFQNTVIGIPQ